MRSDPQTAASLLLFSLLEDKVLHRIRSYSAPVVELSESPAMGGKARTLAHLARAFAQNGARSISTKQPGLNGAALGQVTAPAAHAQPGSKAAFAAQAQAVRVDTQVEVIPEVKSDLYGAVSPVCENAEEGVFRNQDGHRCMGE